LDPINLEDLDETFTPTYVPHVFVKTVKPFFNRATEICKLWNQTQMAFRSAKFQNNLSIDSFDDLIKKAIKLTVYQFKKSRIRTTFFQYYYGTIFRLFTYEKRRT